MPIVLPNEGLVDLLTYMIKSTISGVGNWELRLFQNNYTPIQSSILSNFTVATFTGYSAVTLTRGNWTTPTIISDHAVSTYTTSPQVWTCGATGNTIYGYYMVDTTAGVVRGAERFASSVVLTDGGVLALLPRLTLTTEP